MADRSPEYDLEETLTIETAEQLRALFDDTRREILHLLLERAATISELATTLDLPKGTVGHHVSALEKAGLIRLVRTKKVRAIEAKYYGRTARTFLITSGVESDVGMAPDFFLSAAASEFAKASIRLGDGEADYFLSTHRYARIPEERAREYLARLGELFQEFASEPRGGETTYAMVAAFYPTDRPHLPDVQEPE